MSATPQIAVVESLAVKLRLATLAAYGGSLIFLHYAESLAQKVYDDLCSREGITFGDPTSIANLVFIMVVFAVPTLLARSRSLILANMMASVMTAGGVVLLLFSARDIPYECFTMGGTYEDHTSGLPEFTLWGVFVLLLSFALLAIDLSVWAIRKVRARFEESRGDPGP